MNWKRYRVLIFTGAVSLLASGGLLAWILKTSGAIQGLETDIRGLAGEQTSLSRKPIFPSEKAFLALQAAQETLTQRRDALAAAVSEGQMGVPTMMRAQFGDYVRRMVEDLKAAAAKSTQGGEQGVVLADPQFGFKTYLEGTPPEAGEIPALMVRMELLRHLAGLLFDAGISELVAIEAVKPEPAKAQTVVPGFAPLAPPRGFGATAKPPAGKPGESGPEEAAEIAERDRLFDRVEFRVRFRVYEDHLWGLLNQLAADPNQVVVRRMRVDNQNEGLWPSFLQEDRGAASSSTTRAARVPKRFEDLVLGFDLGGGGDEESPETPSALPGLSSRRERVTGGEMLLVVLDLTVYRLKNPPPATQGS